jgi:RNA polymerase sigma-70 factor (ECF subfamily)
MQTESVGAAPVDAVPVDALPVDAPSADAGGSAGDQSVGWTPPTWEEVVRDHSARVYRLAFRLTGNSHDAEDLTQEVFVRVFRSLSSYTPGTFEGWLHRITTNLFLDMTRRRQRIRFEGLGEETASRLSGAEPTPSQAFDDRHLDVDIAAALADLPPEYRAAVVLCDIEGLTYEEIADVLGVKLGTVRSRIHRGRAQLRAALEHRRPRRLLADPDSAPGQAGPGRVQVSPVVPVAPAVLAPVVEPSDAALLGEVG